jgi:hypothetical protein
VKYIKTYESYYSISEFVAEVTQRLGDYNISPVNINRIIDQKISDMEGCVETGVSPRQFVEELVNELELGSGGYMSIKTRNVQQRNITYF